MECIYRTKVRKWFSNYLDIISYIVFKSPASYDRYIKSFLQDFYVGIIKLVDKAMKRIDTSVRGNMSTEIHKHLYLCYQSSKKFLGREDQLYKVCIRSFLLIPNRKSLVFSVLLSLKPIYVSLFVLFFLGQKLHSGNIKASLFDLWSNWDWKKHVHLQNCHQSE